MNEKDILAMMVREFNIQIIRAGIFQEAKKQKKSITASKFINAIQKW